MASPTIKTPLRYPGGKSLAAKELLSRFPNGVEEYREPFFGGGSVALLFSQRYPNVPVWVNDKYENLYHFWVNVQSNPEELFNYLVKIKEKNNNEDRARKLFNDSLEQIQTETESFNRAWLFWVLNKCSYAGLTETNSSFSPSASNCNFSKKNAEKILSVSKVIKNWKITNDDYSVLMRGEEPNILLYLDPPYKFDKKSFYGKDGEHHNSFSHEQFIDWCKKCNYSWLVTYNKDETLEKEFESFFLSEIGITYKMKRKSGSLNRKRELVITNYENKSTDTLF